MLLSWWALFRYNNCSASICNSSVFVIISLSHYTAVVVLCGKRWSFCTFDVYVLCLFSILSVMHVVYMFVVYCLDGCAVVESIPFDPLYSIWDCLHPK